MVKDAFKFDGPLSDYGNAGLGGFNSTKATGVTVGFVENALSITAEPELNAGLDIT